MGGKSRTEGKREQKDSEYNCTFGLPHPQGITSGNLQSGNVYILSTSSISFQDPRFHFTGRIRHCDIMISFPGCVEQRHRRDRESSAQWNPFN